MKHFLRFFALVFIVFSTKVSAQNVEGSVELGFYFGAQTGFFNTTIPDIPGVDPKSTDVSTSGYAFGALLEYHFTPTVALLGIFRYDYLSLQSNQMGSEGNYIEVNGEKQYYTLFSTSSIKAPQFSTTLFCQYNVIGRLNLLAGAQLGVLTNDQEEIRYNLIFDPRFPMAFDSIPTKIPTTFRGQAPQYFDVTHTSLVLYKGQIFQQQALQVGLSGGLSFDTKLVRNEENTKFITLSNYLFMTYNLTSFSQFEGIHGLTVYFGASFKYTL